MPAPTRGGKVAGGEDDVETATVVGVVTFIALLALLALLARLDLR